jgi:hypothetical protein
VRALPVTLAGRLLSGLRRRSCFFTHSGATWTSLRAKASLPERDAGADSTFQQLDKDAKAISSLIKRLRPGEASSETLKTLTSIKVRGAAGWR